MFSFSGSPAKRKGERDLQRWESAKRRRINKDIVVSVSPDRGIQEETAVDAVVITEAQRSLSVQTEQTGKDIENLMCDNQKRIEEIHLLKQSSKGYPR